MSATARHTTCARDAAASAEGARARRGAHLGLRSVRTAALAAAAALALAMCGCAAAGEDAAVRGGKAAGTAFFAMDTAMSVTVNAEGPEGAAAAEDAARELVVALDGALAPEQKGSEVARLNDQGRLEGASDDVLALAAEASALAEETGGAFDPTIYPLTSAWGFTTGDHRVPAEGEIAALLPLVGYGALEVDGAARTVALSGGAQIDLGGIAKGYAADAIGALLRERGIASALADLGGNVTAYGEKPDGSPFSVGIANPFAPEELCGKIALSDATASTSGGYQRFFVDEAGVRRIHILDPSTGYPADAGLASVTVVAAGGARADALSTALFVMGRDAALGFWRQAGTGEGAFEAVLVGSDGSVAVTEGLAASFEPAGDFAGRVEVVRR